MIHIEPRMTPAQMAGTLDAAMRHPKALTYLDMVVTALKTAERHADGTAVAWVGCLLAENEVEILMGLRAAWRRGEDRSPAKAAQCRFGFNEPG